MKVLILAGGLGTRLSEETELKPKPMVEIGGHPILWHIMKIYSFYGFNEFIILTGYKGHIIKDYFINYYTRYSDISIDMQNNSLEIHNIKSEPWKVTMLYTGQDSMTGGRIKYAKDYVDGTFMLTYGDGLANIDIKKLVEFHKSHNGAITMSAVQPEGKFGVLNIENDNKISNFTEKPKGEASVNNSGGGWINGGFFVCEPKIFDYIDNDLSVFEQEPLKNLSKNGELYSFKHYGFWKCMDTLRDKNELCSMWINKSAPWALWL